MKNLLVVDDDEFIQTLLKSTLEEKNYQVDVTGSAEETEEYLKKKIPDLFIIDIILPGKSGLQLCANLRRSDKTSDIPILILSSKHTLSDRVKGLEIGADDYLVKPFHLEELAARVKALLRRVAKHSEKSVPETQKIRPVEVAEARKKPAPKVEKKVVSDPFTERKDLAFDHFNHGRFQEALVLFEELFRERPNDIEIKRYLGYSRVQLMKRYMARLGSKDAIPVRTSDRAENYIGLDFNSEEGFIFSRIDGKTDLKGIVLISGMKPLKAYGILYHFHESGVIRLKK